MHNSCLAGADEVSYLQLKDDEELGGALDSLDVSLKENIQMLSSFEKYKKEVLGDSLDWTPMHTSLQVCLPLPFDGGLPAPQTTLPVCHSGSIHVNSADMLHCCLVRQQPGDHCSMNGLATEGHSCISKDKIESLQHSHYIPILCRYLLLVPTLGMPAVLEGECGEV